MQALQFVRCALSYLHFHCMQPRWSRLLPLLLLLGSVQFAASAGSLHSSTQQQLQDYRKLNFEHFLKLAARHLTVSETAGSPSCSADYGEQYLGRWNKLQDQFCNASASSSSSSSSSAAAAAAAAVISSTAAA
ncbi:hypothetical protein COO60DRAFT_1133511 [Scenedesmus sp. NREL 46B-D3]|nr:hypothetical protein COO60DRAFT_1133511 [Scenedesmus sp. NREL 46B-D3]